MLTLITFGSVAHRTNILSHGIEAHSLERCCLDSLMSIESKPVVQSSIVTLIEALLPRPLPNREQGLLCDTSGTYTFLAPECIQGERFSGYGADTWAAGVTLYTWIFGEVPFYSTCDCISC